MRMRQSIAELERAFVEEARADREKREAAQRQAALRARQREIARTHKHGRLRYFALICVLIATAVLVTIAMFTTLYYVMG